MCPECRDVPALFSGVSRVFSLVFSVSRCFRLVFLCVQSVAVCLPFVSGVIFSSRLDCVVVFIGCLDM